MQSLLPNVDCNKSGRAARRNPEHGQETHLQQSGPTRNHDLTFDFRASSFLGRASYQPAPGTKRSSFAKTVPASEPSDDLVAYRNSFHLARSYKLI